MSKTVSPIKTALCAYGMSGQVFHAPFLKVLDEFSFHGVVERHTKKAAEKYPDVRSYNSIEEMLADPTVELVIVNTPNTTHYGYTKQALLAGKHVVVEKPFTATSEEAKELQQLAEKQQKKLVVFQNRRWDSDFLAIKEVIDQRLLGTLIDAEFRWDRYKPALSYKVHKEIKQPGAGNIYDLGPHLIDQTICLFGKPEKLFAIVQTHRADSEVDDYFDISLLYPNVNVRLKSSLLALEPVPSFVLQGSEGSFLKSRSDIQETVLQEGILPSTPDWGQEPESEWGILHTSHEGKESREKFASPAGHYQSFFQGVYHHIRDNAPSPVPLQDSVLNIQIIEAALQSSRTGQTISLD
jgi:predicted dehydrogenase